MPETVELSQRVTSLEKRVLRLESDVSSLRSELTEKMDVKNSELLEKIMAIEKEQASVSTMLRVIQNKLELLSTQPSFEAGLQAKISQFALFCAAAAIGALIVQLVQKVFLP